MEKALDRKSKAETALQEAQAELDSANEFLLAARTKLQNLQEERKQEIAAETKPPDPTMGQAAELLLDIIKHQQPQGGTERHSELIDALSAFVKSLRGDDTGPDSALNPGSSKSGQGDLSAAQSSGGDVRMEPSPLVDPAGPTKRAASSPPGGKEGAKGCDPVQPSATARTAPWS